MLSAGRLVTSLRYRLGDMQGAAYSDFELLEAVNRAASLLFSRMGARYVYAAVKKAVMVVDGTGVGTLPRDFHNARRVTREGTGELDPATGYVCPAQYRVTGDSFLAAEGVYGLEYYYLPRPARDLEGELDAPESVSPWLEQAALALLSGDAAGAAQVCEACCDALAAGEFSHLTDRGPEQVFGGRL